MDDGNNFMAFNLKARPIESAFIQVNLSYPNQMLGFF
jgi:hypothetical protein